jgi:hypothetical protein
MIVKSRLQIYDPDPLSLPISPDHASFEDFCRSLKELVFPIRARSERRAKDRIAGWANRMLAVAYSPSKHDLCALHKSDQPGGQLVNL